MKQLSSYQFKDIYKDLDIDMKGLYCVMLEVKYKDPMPEIAEKDQYKDETGDYTWVDGYVAKDGEMHCTLLYGLLEGCTKEHVEEVLSGWKKPKLVIEEISKFEGADDAPYYTVIAKVKVTDGLQEGHGRLSFLPHIDTFPEYKPHITLAYIKKSGDKMEFALAKAMTAFEFLVGKELDIDEISYDNNSGEKATVELY